MHIFVRRVTSTLVVQQKQEAIFPNAEKAKSILRKIE